MIESHTNDTDFLGDVKHACLNGGYALTVYNPESTDGFICERRRLLRKEKIFDSRESEKWVLELVPTKLLKRAELRAMRPTARDTITLRSHEIIDSLLTSQASLDYFEGKDTLAVYFDESGKARADTEKLTRSANDALLAPGLLGALVFENSVESLSEVLPKFLDQETFDSIFLAIFDSDFVHTTFTTYLEENPVEKDLDRFLYSMFVANGHLVVTKFELGNIMCFAPKRFPILLALSQALKKASVIEIT